MKKDKVKNVFLSILVILFIAGSLILIIKSIDYSKKISNKNVVTKVKNKNEIIKNKDKPDEKIKSNYEDSNVQKSENETINENIKDVSVQTEKPKTISKSDYSFIEDIKDPEAVR